ncbi:hypothetical protein Bca101_025327 [Brassica carinata]
MVAGPYQSSFVQEERVVLFRDKDSSVKNTGRGKNSKRRIIGDNVDGGSWKPNAKKYIEDKETKKAIGKKQTLKFIRSDNNKKKQKKGDGTSIRKISNSMDEDDHHESIPASSSEQQPTNIDHETVVAPSSLEHQPPLSCRRGEANMVHQMEDTFAVIEMVPRRPSPKDEKVEAMEVTHNVEEEGWIGDVSEKFASTGLDDQQQTPIYAAPPARLGDRSLPIEVDEDDEPRA